MLIKCYDGFERGISLFWVSILWIFSLINICHLSFVTISQQFLVTYLLILDEFDGFYIYFQSNFLNPTNTPTRIAFSLTYSIKSPNLKFLFSLSQKYSSWKLGINKCKFEQAENELTQRACRSPQALKVPFCWSCEIKIPRNNHKFELSSFGQAPFDP